MKYFTSLFALLLLLSALHDQTLSAQDWQWETLTATGQPTARHEAALVAYKDKVYLIGGRRINPVDVFDPATSTWTAKAKTPLELHHFQAIVVEDAIYLIGAMTGPWPKETPLEKIVVYYPEQDKFEFVHSIPEQRRRGGAGAVLHNGKIYIVGGITNGHMDGFQPWLDEYDPKTGAWTPLADAPHARDHFQAVVLGDRLYASAGRTTLQRNKQGFELTVEPVDVYDFKTTAWLAAEDTRTIPTPRAGNMAMTWQNEIIIGGGESGSQHEAHSEVEAFNVNTGQWRDWPQLTRGRHGSGFAVVGEYVYTASGSGNRGGGPELTTIERLKLQTDVSAASPAKPIEQAGTIQQWHTHTLSFEGPETSESAATNPFTDYRLQVTFTHAETEKNVRGFYAADGNAAETSADSGNIWQVRFAPDLIGTWTYSASLRKGEQIAISNDPNAGEPIEISNASGSFQTVPVSRDTASESSRDFRKRGRLTADGPYFRFGKDGARWLKGGADSPENLLAFADFDGTFRQAAKARDGENAPPTELHTFPTHAADWKSGDPQWQAQGEEQTVNDGQPGTGKGRALIGGINYLADQGMNVMYFLTLNIGGDGKDVWPYVSPDDFTRFDCSKLEQWEIVFEHMQRRGIMMHVVTQETENERLLDDGDVGPMRKLYYNELIARFAHHPALAWNLGEENGPADFSPNGQNAKQQQAMATYLKTHDPYRNTVVIHTHSVKHEKDELLPALLGHASLDGLSFQVNEPSHVHDEIIKWRKLSADAGHPWMICMDEIGPWHTGALPDSIDPNHDSLRRQVLWGSLLAGGAGVEWYFGAHHPHHDLNCEDWRTRENLWKQTRHALEFFESQLPYWEMQPSDELTTANDDYCFAKPGQVYAIYFSQSSEQQPTTLDLQSHDGRFSVRWYDPIKGGDLQAGSVAEIAGPGKKLLGNPPEGDPQDRVILVTKKD